MASLEACAGGFAGGLLLVASLEASLEVSERAWSLLLDGEVAALWGVAPGGRGSILARPPVGIVWAMTADSLARHRRLAARVSRQAVAELLELYPALVNWVDARYRSALRWVRWLGFEVGEAQPLGVAGLPFHPIVLRRPHV